MLKQYRNYVTEDLSALDKEIINCGGNKVDLLDLFYEDLYEIRYPRLNKKKSKKALKEFKSYLFKLNPENHGRWIWYPL
jgi:hypothetical protein